MKFQKLKNIYIYYRSSSTENDFHDKPPIRGSLYRKSLSLEQNFGNNDQVTIKLILNNLFI